MNIIDNFAMPPALINRSIVSRQGLWAEEAKLNTGYLDPHCHKQHLLIVYLAPNVLIEAYGDKKIQKGLFTASDVGVYPAGEYGKISWDSAVYNIFININDVSLREFAETRFGHSNFTLEEKFLVKDPLISQIGKSLISSNPDSALHSLYNESLCNTLYLHLLTFYSNFKDRCTDSVGPISYTKIKNIDDYISAHEGETITLAALAGLANCSVFNFTRLFKKSTGYSPYQYVLWKKMQAAQKLLQAPDATITDIAYKLGFSSPAHFNAVFKKRFGKPPGKYFTG